MKKATIWIIIIILVLLGIWYFMSRKNSAMMQQSAATPTSMPASTSGDTSQSTPVLMLSSDTTLGNHLAAANGMTLYMYSKDTPGVSNCADTCATNWPPYTVASADEFSAAAGITGTFGTTTRTDGTIQLTYNGMPLYFFASDTKPGDVTGQNVGGFTVVQS